MTFLLCFVIIFVIVIVYVNKKKATGDCAMRVIAGLAKGHKLKTIETTDTRPTTDRIKETLFNMISFDLAGCCFLDLFSGSGAIGIEALSRGAEECVFVEQSVSCQQVIRDNLEHTRMSAKTQMLLPLGVTEALDKLGNEKKSFDIIFMDPPYASGLIEPSLRGIIENHLLRKDGYIIVERSAKIPLLPIDGLRVLKEKEYRTTIMTFLCLEEEIL